MKRRTFLLGAAGAAAATGLGWLRPRDRGEGGHSAYFEGLNTEDSAVARRLFEESLLNHLRVVTIYKEERGLVPQSLYVSAMSMRRLGGKENTRRASQLFSRLCRFFPNSQWTRKAATDLNTKCK